ncbi:MAG TPA: UDP-3-O-(3-hydroxymyristoyl)glucosamine N-acyltransferase [Aeromonadales bacterium]|nr:UDP-3-O-(3-hydroxymyristoyl)glucosamine N-acyltransferase [Aeromonadales bacterium]
MTQPVTLGELAEKIDATLVCKTASADADTSVSKIADLEQAGPDGVSFVSGKGFLEQLKSTHAAAVILKPEWEELCPVSCLLLDDPYLGYAKAAQLFDTTPELDNKIHPSAQIADNVSIALGVRIGANAVIDSGVTLEENVQIGAGTVIGKNSVIGSGSTLKANVTLYHNIHVGQRVLIHSGTIIGSDGFGFANEAGCWLKIPQLGGVIIGHDVEIGANCTIDRGALKNTIIGDGVIMDNLIHIAHNVVVGEHSAMAAFVGIAGSSVLGERCTLSGGVSVIGHLNIPAGTHFTVRTLVTKSPDKADAYSSGSVMMTNREWRKNVARIKQLGDMAKRVKSLEKQLQQLQKNNS